jgi:hypothetical protein
MYSIIFGIIGSRIFRAIVALYQLHKEFFAALRNLRKLDKSLCKSMVLCKLIYYLDAFCSIYIGVYSIFIDIFM